MSRVGLRIGVVVPCKDEIRTLGDCLVSVRAQTSPPVLVVVVDNGSTDGSLAVAGAGADIVLESAAPTIAALRNLGVSAADACDAYAFIDADCVASRDWLAAGTAALQDADVVGARVKAASDAGWVAVRWADVETRISRATSYVGSANMVIRRSTFARVGGFDESLATTEDVDLCHRVRSGGGRVLVVDAMVVTHHGAPRGLIRFAARQMWHASAAGWWWMMSPKARALVMACLVWSGTTLAVVVKASVRRSRHLPLAWGLASSALVPGIGLASGGRRTAARDGLLLVLWGLVHAARAPRGLRRR